MLNLIIDPNTGNGCSIRLEDEKQSIFGFLSAPNNYTHLKAATYKLLGLVNYLLKKDVHPTFHCHEPDCPLCEAVKDFHKFDSGLQLTFTQNCFEESKQTLNSMMWQMENEVHFNGKTWNFKTDFPKMVWHWGQEHSVKRIIEGVKGEQ
jgi:hypothetical protein